MKVPIRYLTKGELRAACEKHPYIVVQDSSGWEMAVNTGVAPIIHRLRPRTDSYVTGFVKWRACSFQEYISKKHPFQ